MREKLLYHGTDISVAHSNVDIYGIVDTNHPEVSGNLTDDILFAMKWALRRSEGMVDWARVLVFRFALDQITDLGEISGYSSHGYATKILVSEEEVPDDYFLARRMRREMFEGRQSQHIYFYKAPKSNLVEIRTLG